MQALIDAAIWDDVPVFFQTGGFAVKSCRAAEGYMIEPPPLRGIVICRKIAERPVTSDSVRTRL